MKRRGFLSKLAAAAAVVPLAATTPDKRPDLREVYGDTPPKPTPAIWDEPTDALYSRASTGLGQGSVYFSAPMYLYPSFGSPWMGWPEIDVTSFGDTTRQFLTPSQMAVANRCHPEHWVPSTSPDVEDDGDYDEDY